MEGVTPKEKITLEKTNKFLKKIRPSFILVLIIILGVLVGNFIYVSIYNWYYDDGSNKSSVVDDSDNTSNSNCSVVGINLHGNLLTYIPLHSENDITFNYNSVASEDIVAKIKQADDDSNIKAIVLEVDSGGGSPIAGEEISNAVKNSAKPVVGYIRETGASSSYWAISSATRIFASKNSNVGAIGITGSYLTNVSKNKKDGYEYQEIASGKYKDSGNPNKFMTNDEKAIFLRDVNIMYQNFMEAISQNRKIPIDKVKSFSDGSTVLGEKAKSLGLVDEIGGMNEIEKYLKDTTGENSEICWK